MPTRPANVPATAEFSESYKLWGEGPIEAGTKRHGRWQWWSPDDGRLVAIETYDSGNCNLVESFYPNGRALAATVMHDGKTGEQRFFIDRSQDWKELLRTSLTIPLESIPASAVEVRKIPNVYPLSYEFFDAEARKITRVGITREAADALVNEALVHEADETAAAAVDRYTRLCDRLAEASSNSADEMARWRMHFSKPIDPAELAAAEKRLDCKLPPSYVEFVTRRGVFFGPGEYLKMSKPGELATLHDRLLKSQRAKTSKQLAKKLGLDEASIAALKRTVVFSTGQYEELLAVFQLDGVDAATGEAPIVTFDLQEGIDATPTRAASGREVDRHVSELIDDSIRRIEKWL